MLPPLRRLVARAVALAILATPQLPGASTAVAARPAPPAPALTSEFAERRQAPARSFDVHHLRLDLTVDLEARRVAGEATLTLSPLGVAFDQLVLHAVALDVKAVEVAGAGPARFAIEPDMLRIWLERAHAPKDTLIVRIRYSATEPKQGLYFVASDEAYKRPLQLWSQGETEENRHWFPAWDYPNDRATSEMVVTVPAGFTAVSNGALESQRDNPDGTVTFHWYERRPHVNYLVSLVVGKFVHISEKYGAIPLDIYVPPGKEELVPRSFGNTADMMRVFEQAFGHPYPYEKYAQTTVHDFMWGGMENVSATTLTERTLHDEAAHLTFQSDDLLAHELAHQWFGDLITCRSWSHAWLNEGFATFGEIVYFESKWSEDGLADQLIELRSGYLDEYENDYRRAIVTDVYGGDWDLFDAHLFEKGALVLHMLRKELGEEVFGRAISHYVNKHAWETVDTSQLRIAIEESSGRDLGVFFDQWLYRGGHPVLEASWSWDEERKQVEVEVKQVQEVDELTPYFDIPLAIRVTFCEGDGDHVDQRVRLREEREVFHLPAERRPRFVQLDPESWLLAEIDFQKPVPELAIEVAEAREVMGRVAAAQALGDITGDLVALDALGRALTSDPSRHVRAAAATSLGEIGTESALLALTPGLEDADARVRRDVAKALGSFRSEQAGRLATRLIDQDPSPYVVGDAAEALGKTKAEGALSRLVRAAGRESHDEAIRRGAYAGMAALKSADAMPHLLRATRYGMPWRARGKAIESLGKLAKALPEDRAEIRRRLLELVGDRHFDARRMAVAALGRSEDPEALPDLRQLARTSPEPGIRNASRLAVWRILQAQKPTDLEIAKRLDAVERENRQLREDLERLRERSQGEDHATERR